MLFKQNHHKTMIEQLSEPQMHMFIKYHIICKTTAVAADFVHVLSIDRSMNQLCALRAQIAEKSPTVQF